MARNVSRPGRRSSKRRNNRLATWRAALGGPARRAVFEVLEQRAMLTVAQDLQNLIAPYQSAINTALSVATSLPLVGHQLTALQELNTLLQNSLQSIEDATQNVTSDGHFQIAIALPSISHTFTFNLGLDAFLKVSTAGGVTASINPVLNVGFDYQNGSVSLDEAQTNLDIGFGLTLPNFQATASLNGLLYAHVVDQGTSFNGHLVFGFDDSGDVSPHFSGDAHIRLGLTLSFVDPALNVSFNPTFLAQLQLDWSIDSQSNQLDTPHIALKNFALDADSFMHNFLGDIVTSVQKYTKPLEPFLDTFDTPVPVLSAFDSSETVGDLLLQGAGLSQDLQDRFNVMVKVIRAVNTFDLSGSTGGAVITFGDINLTGDATVAGGFNFDTSQLPNAVGEIFNSPALKEVQNVMEEVANYAGDATSAGFTFPLLENPGQVIGGILTGQTETMFSFSTGREHFELAPSIGFGIKDLFGVFLTAGVVFDADFTMGYDTGGLTKLIQDPNHQPVDLLHGFYFDNSVDSSAPPIPNVSAPKKTALYLQGFAEISGSAIATLSGGIYANLSVELASTDHSSRVALDSMIQNLGAGTKAFNATGKLYASAQIELTLDTEVGPKITLFDYQLARKVLVNYDPPPPPAFNVPAVIIDVADQHSLQLDPSKMPAGSGVTVQPFEGLSIASGGTSFVGDGIRVDYPNEIDLYVERKNGVNTNYYNLVGVNGVAPDGDSIDIIDPFRVFADEGATDPDPPQTKPGVVLVGGRNVSYAYSENSDGSHPTVLLAGGYGFNTLNGGTMEFGNFIPADRIDQAKQHFGDESGFDASGVALINSSVSADIAPADPTGVIGATMTASGGGLMLGGAGNNSFIATGPGAYQMIGGPWINTFNIRPSFNGVPAAYQIDGGPFGQSQLVVRVPADENVTFENATIPDKYNPSLKALAVEANAGLSATAHGIQAVHIVGASGSHAVIGDTSELNIDFSISGGAHLTFGGTNAPDNFTVTTSGSYYDGKDHFTLPKFASTPNGIQLPAIYGLILPSRFPDPIYSITRTFGTNHVTQTIPFTVDDEDNSSIALDGGGARDTYNITMGVGAFIDVSVNDSDPTTQNPLTVNVRDGHVVNNIATLTDNAVHLDYYTDVVYQDFLPKFETGLSYDYSASTSSVHDTPTVTFGSNEDITLASAFPFIQTIVNRPTAPQKASIVVDGQYYLSYIPYEDLGAERTVFDPTTVPYTMFNADLASYSLDVQANAGPLTINMGTVSRSLTTDIDSNSGQLSLSLSHDFAWLDTFNIYRNSGTTTINTDQTTGTPTGLSQIINVYDSIGTLNIQTGRSVGYIVTDTQVNIGLTHGLDDVQGTIDFASNYNLTSQFDIVVDDRNGSSSSAWTFDRTSIQIGNLNINNAQYIFGYSTAETYWRSGTHLTLIDNPPPFHLSFNGSSTFPLGWIAPLIGFEQNHEADNVSLSLAAFSTPPRDPVSYSATGLPPGLSLDSSTGLISGTIPIGASLNSPYNVVYTVTSGDYTVRHGENWIVNGTIDLEIFFLNPADADEGSRVDLQFYVNNFVNRPVTLSLLGAPSWLTLDPDNGDIYGTPPVGSATHGPYHLDLHATDGVSSSDAPFDLDVSGIKFPPVQGLRFNQTGESVDFSVPATTSTGLPLTYSALDLPAGVNIDPATGEISGTLSGSQTQASYGVNVYASDGLTTRAAYFIWNVLPAGASDAFNLISPGTQIDQVNEPAYVHIGGESSQLLNVTYSIQGLPAGFGVNGGYVSGAFSSGDVTGSPYHVTVTASDGRYSASTQFDWYATAAGPITITNPYTQQNYTGSSVHVQISASTTSGHPLTYSATNLPTGLSINPQTGMITGTVGMLSALPGYFDTKITVTDGVTTASSTFQWTITTASQLRFARLPLPDGGTIELDSAPGTEVSAAIHLSPDAAPPDSIQFPFGFVTYSVQASIYEGATAPLSTTNMVVTIRGASYSSVNNDYEYGPTPANPTPHWYSFIAGHQTDSDSASNTGMEVVGGGTFYRIFVDGARGDDDLTKNGVILGVGGLAITTTGTDPYTVSNTNDSGAGSLRQAILNANGASGLVHTITFALPTGPQTINLQSPLPAIFDSMIAVVDATQNVTILSSGGATDSFATVVKTGAGTLAFGDVSHVGGSLQVSGGLLRLVGSGTPSFAAGVSATVSGSGALELAGTVSDLNASINIANNSTATAGIVVTGQNQIVGGIDGAGNVAVSDGGGVTASHITAGSLVIGNGGTFTLDASDAAGNPLAQSAPAIAFVSSSADANSQAVEESDALSSSDAVTPIFATESPTRPAANSPPAVDKLQGPIVSGDWFSKRSAGERLSSQASPTIDKSLPSVTVRAALEVVPIKSDLIDVILENRGTTSGRNHSTKYPWADAVDDELISALAAEKNHWGVFESRTT